jgi:hypothetical protein
MCGNQHIPGFLLGATHGKLSREPVNAIGFAYSPRSLSTAIVQELSRWDLLVLFDGFYIYIYN